MKDETILKQAELFSVEEIKMAAINEAVRQINAIERHRIRPINRQQMLLRAVEIEKLIAEDHQARAIWELVGRLDLSRYYKDIKVMEGEAGRSAYNPQMLISVWIYSYSKGISSGREICRLCGYDPAYQWLTGMEIINYHTLSDFRTDNKEALNELFTEVLGILSAEGLVTLERVMHDGTKIKACVSSSSFRREGKIRAHIKAAEEQVKLMNEAGEEETSLRANKARERAVREKKQKLEFALQELEKIRAAKSNTTDKKEARVSETDPEARIMKQGDSGFAPSYNVQISTDAEAKIITGMHVSQSGGDYEELVKSEEDVENRMGRKPEQMVVDGGFISRENILSMNDREIDLIGPTNDHTGISLGQLRKRGIDLEFYPSAFKYHEESDTYICPAGKTLKCEGKEVRIGITRHRYTACIKDCVVCPFKDKCCPGAEKKGRMIMRNEEDPVVTAFNDKMNTEEAKAIYKQRGAVAEFPNAWIKDKLKLRQFRLRGLIKAGIEALWACLTYNIQQWIRLRWKSKMVLATA